MRDETYLEMLTRCRSADELQGALRTYTKKELEVLACILVVPKGKQEHMISALIEACIEAGIVEPN